MGHGDEQLRALPQESKRLAPIGAVMTKFALWPFSAERECESRQFPRRELQRDLAVPGVARFRSSGACGRQRGIDLDCRHVASGLSLAPLQSRGRCIDLDDRRTRSGTVGGWFGGHCLAHRDLSYGALFTLAGLSILCEIQALMVAAVIVPPGDCIGAMNSRLKA